MSSVITGRQRPPVPGIGRPHAGRAGGAAAGLDNAVPLGEGGREGGGVVGNPPRFKASLLLFGRGPLVSPRSRVSTLPVEEPGEEARTGAARGGQKTSTTFNFSPGRCTRIVTRQRRRDNPSRVLRSKSSVLQIRGCNF